MARIRFNGPDHILRLPGGEEVPRGGETSVPRQLAEQLLAWPAVDVSVYGDSEPVARPHVEEPPRTGIGSGRAAWAEHAARIGVPVEAHWSRDRIIAAVEQAAGGEPGAPITRTGDTPATPHNATQGGGLTYGRNR